ncbi:MAG: branched-chain amino acid ABC transporter substrate-binding protein [Spirochaetales bacterium]|nr:branched-chain amino acid ABC transporter substrate-binding protein [Spirochaetales bacterium]
MKKISVVLLTLVVALALGLTGCQQGAKTIKIGVGGAHTGDLASYGLPTVNAAQLVAEEINAAGGIDGKMIELVVEDDQCKPEIATNTASKLAGEGVVAVLGHICSGATKAALGIYQDSDLVTISPSATNPDLTKDYTNFYRTIASDNAQAVTEVEFIQSMGLTKIAVLHDKGDYGKGFAELVQSGATAAGIEVVLFEGVTPGGVDYSAILNKVDNSGAEALVWGGYHPEASKLVTQMKNKGMDMPFLSDDGVKDQTFIDVAGEFAEGVYATGPIDTSSTPLYQKAGADHLAKYGEEPGAFFYNAYAAMLAICNAIDVADSTEYAAITEALTSNYVDTPLGSISFDKGGEAIGVGFVVYQVQGGVFVEAE